MENRIFHELVRKNEVRCFARENLSLSNSQSKDNTHENLPENLRQIKAEFFKADQHAYQNLYCQFPPEISCIGKAKRFIKRAIRKLYSNLLGWLVFPLYDKQTIFNKSLLNGTNLLCDYTLQERDKLTQRIDYLENLCESLIQENKSFLKDLDIFRDECQNFMREHACEKKQEEIFSLVDERIQQSEKKIKEYTSDLSAKLDESLSMQGEQLRQYKVSSDLEFSEANQKIEQLVKSTAGLSPELLSYIKDTLNISCDINLIKGGKLNYFDFENHFRGSRTLIKERFAAYVPYFQIPPTEMVADLGCGRGEFIELMYENGVHVKGVDNYQPFIDYCRERGFDVDKSDALTWLNSCPDNSLSGIFMGQVIEHVSFDYAIALIKCAYRKLKVDCYFVLETPNSQSLSTYCNFYIDAGHTKPIHYATLEYIFNIVGYQNIQRLNNELTLSKCRLSLLEDSIQVSDSINKNITILNNTLFGYEDYSLIAKK